jgi:cell division septal protein FtsQ
MKIPFSNKRVSSRKQRQQQHLLDVKVRSGKAREQRNRRILKWGCMLMLLSCLSGGIYVGAREGLRRFVWQNPDYMLRQVEITNDGALPREQVMEASGLEEGTNIFSINISRIRESLLRVPQIETAEVQRVLPDKIVITVTERHPVAWVTSKRDEDPTAQPDAFLADSRGVVFQNKNQPQAYLHLPVICGVQTGDLEAGQSLQSPEIRAALDLIRLNAADGTLQARFQATSIDVSKGYCLGVTDRNHAQITFGLEHIDLQLERLMTLLDRIEQDKREVQTVNLMVQRNIPVTFVPDPDAPAPAAETKPAGGKTEKTGEKSADGSTKKSQTVGQKKAMPVKKAHAATDGAEPPKTVKKAIPLNSP